MFDIRQPIVSQLQGIVTQLQADVLANPIPAAPTPSPSFPIVLADWMDRFKVATSGGLLAVPSPGSLLFGPAPIGNAGAGVTKSALLLHNPTVAKPVTDFDVTLSAQTLEQYRQPTPNAWECFWFLFNLQEGTPAPAAFTTKTANYVAVKPNGLEIGNMSGTVGQTFLAELASIGTPIDKEFTLRVVKKGQTLAVYLNSVQVFSQTFMGGSANSNVGGAAWLFSQPGAFAFYCEDSGCAAQSFQWTGA